MVVVHYYIILAYSILTSIFFWHQLLRFGYVLITMKKVLYNKYFSNITVNKLLR